MAAPKVQPEKTINVGDMKKFMIFGAIKKLDPNDDFSTGGKRKIAALQEMLDIDISAKERDEAFSYYQPEYVRTEGKFGG